MQSTLIYINLKNKQQVHIKYLTPNLSVSLAYVPIPTLPHFEWEVPNLSGQLLPSCFFLKSHFEMILTGMSDIYEFFRSITLFTNLMEKSRLLATKLGGCILLATIFIISSRSVSIKPLIIVLEISKEGPGMSLWISTIIQGNFGQISIILPNQLNNSNFPHKKISEILLRISCQLVIIC